jgi:hypothetical protein
VLHWLLEVDAPTWQTPVARLGRPLAEMKKHPMVIENYSTNANLDFPRLSSTLIHCLPALTFEMFLGN